MNPYSPPLAKDEPPAAGAVMQLRYGPGYTWMMVAMALMVPLPSAILALTRSNGLIPLLAILPASLVVLWLAWETRRAVFVEVFEDRLEIPSLGLKKLRWKKPLNHKIPRWCANREDYAKFQAWRQERGLV